MAYGAYHRPFIVKHSDEKKRYTKIVVGEAVLLMVVVVGKAVLLMVVV
jgi:hypothetical protein